MTSVIYKGIRRACAPNETVLDCLRRSGVDVPSSCRAGVCQSCMLRCASGAPPSAASQKGLSAALKDSGHFLACCAVPSGEMEVAPPGVALSTARAKVIDKERMAPDIVRLRLSCLEPFSWRGGQFIQLVRDDGLVRSFSLASLAEDGWLELHVRRVRGGRMSEWIHDSLQPGDTVTVRGPAGECFYAPEQKEQPMLLVGTGTGAAPLWGILKDAVVQQHEGPMIFIHAARESVHHYLDAQLRTLSQRHGNIDYRPVHHDRLAEVVTEAVPEPKGFKIALCGSPDTVKSLTLRLYLAGAALEDIVSDPFVAAPPGG